MFGLNILNMLCDQESKYKLTLLLIIIITSVVYSPAVGASVLGWAEKPKLIKSITF
jgi:hypothetical protein